MSYATSILTTPERVEPQRVIVYQSKFDYDTSRLIEENPGTFLIIIGLLFATIAMLWVAALWVEHRKKRRKWLYRS